MQPGPSRQRQRFLPLAILVLALLVLPQLARQSWGAGTASKQAVVAVRPAAALETAAQLPSLQSSEPPVPSSEGTEVSTTGGQAWLLASQELGSVSPPVASSGAQLGKLAPSPPPPTPPSPPPPTPPSTPPPTPPSMHPPTQPSPPLLTLPSTPPPPPPSTSPPSQHSPIPPPGPEVLFVIRTHVMNDLVSKMLAQLSTEFGPDAVFVLLDDTKEPSNGTRIWRDLWTPGQQMLYVNELECKDASSFHNAMYTEGQTPMGMMYKYLEPVDFQYIWFIDWDVYCHGHYKACFAMPPGTDQDLLVDNIQNLASVEWPHTEKLAGELSTLPREKRWKSFFPLVRFSKGFLHRLYSQLHVSGGFCELLTPTLCATTEGCTMRNIPNERLGVFRYALPWEDQRCSPPKEPDNKFYHPCKGLLLRDG